MLAGFSLAEADVLRKAVGKKDAELIKKELGQFVERAVAQGHPTKLIEELAAQIETFGRYGFNKSHSVAYSVLSYQTAWLKAHYPAEFMAALLSSEIGDTDKVVKYINEARELGLEVLPPDVNESGFKFTVVGDKRIRFGLGAVRNVGARRDRVDPRRRGRTAPFDDALPTSCERIDLRLCNKRVLESLIAAGACDSLGGHRAQLLAALDAALGEAQLTQQEREAGQASLFGEAPAAAARGAPTLPDVPPLARGRAAGEGEGDPRLLHLRPPAGAVPRRRCELFGTRTTATLGEWSEHQVTHRRGGHRGQAADLQEDRQGVRAARHWRISTAPPRRSSSPRPGPSSTRRSGADAALLLTGGYSARDQGEDRAPFIVESAPAARRSSGSRARWRSSLRWRAPEPRRRPTRSAPAAALCAAHPGPAPVYIEWSDGNGEAGPAPRRAASASRRDDDLVRALRELLGADAVHYVKAG